MCGEEPTERELESQIPRAHLPLSFCFLYLFVQSEAHSTARILGRRRWQRLRHRVMATAESTLAS